MERGIRFWLIIVGICAAIFAACLEATVVATALPTIARALNADEFIWVGTSYSITSAAVIPIIGGFTEAFGRKPVMLSSLILLTLGSALAGAAQTMSWLVAARAIAGAGAGAIAGSCLIILSDIVPLDQRGGFLGILGLMQSLSGGVGPLIGGALSDAQQWRWSFFIITPLAAFAAVIVALCFNLPHPEGTLVRKAKSIDWVGVVLIAGSTVALILGISWGGVQFAWSSPQVIISLTFGATGLALFFAYEIIFAKNPLVPLVILSNWSSASGFLQTLLLSIPYNSLTFYLPVYYQACMGASATASGVDLFNLSFTVSPIAMITGITISKLKVYRPQIWAGWILTILGCGVLNFLDANANRAVAVGLPVIAGVGIGLVWSSVQFPVLAPLPVELNARALSLFGFCRILSQTWGIAIGGAILQSELVKHLSHDTQLKVSGEAQVAYALIREIPQLPTGEQGLIRDAFARSLATIWQVVAGVAGAGLLISLLMRHYAIHSEVDSKWQTKDENGAELVEAEKNMSDMGGVPSIDKLSSS